MRYLSLIFVIIYLSGCTYAYGPQVSNNFTSSIILEQTYADNTTKKDSIMPLIITAIGRGDTQKDTLTRLKIIKDKQTIYDLNNYDIKKMIMLQNKVNRPTVWTINKVGIYLQYSEYKSKKIIFYDMKPPIKLKIGDHHNLRVENE